MPLRPVAWIAAIFFFLLLVADLVFGIVAAFGGLGEVWGLWGPVLAVVGSWVVAVVGGIFSIYILRIVKFLTVLYVIAAIIFAIVALVVGRWDALIAMIIVAVVSVFVGGLLVKIDQTVVAGSIESKLRNSF